MKHFTVDTIDHARYKPQIHIQVSGGSRPRITLVHQKTGQKYFFKTYSHNPREVWAECLASHLGQVLGVPMQQLVIKRASSQMVKILKTNFPDNLPKKWIPIGTLARNIFLHDEEIIYGEKIVGTKSDALELSSISKAISNQYYAPEDLLQSFAEMIIFDALIGNMDRHHENWGIVETLRYKQQLLFGKKQLVDERHFVPLYDHGSSLLFELDDDLVDRFLADETLFCTKYVFGSKYSFVKDAMGKESNVFEVIKQNIEAKSDWGKRFIKTIKKLAPMSKLEVAKELVKMPNSSEFDYSNDRKELLFRSILIRHKALVDMLE